ncbi:winged helix-turn-helix transcriptional regulator [Lactiplantibacillus garii]|uniref:Winged helix-turn-helix transcriptional regulator n=1 Tax=Lactiplantibacillus garii TaxID=2306423 RepID=A0A426D8T6_9LACO|nr:MarR family transcriptional regulator [Lactiplantibacillus garii]RRK11010.1 winged helix-turn-helix transcriptional regulator [Lactiplantibacillus garii]
MGKSFDYILDIMRLERSLKRLTASWSAQTGLSLNELRILLYVSQAANQPITKVSTELGISKGSLAQSIGALTQDGLLQSEPILPDRRLRSLTLTEAGEKQVLTVQQALVGTLGTPTAKVFTDQLSALDNDL